MKLNVLKKDVFSPINVLPFFFTAVLFFFFLNFDPYAIEVETKQLISQLTFSFAALLCIVYLVFEYKFGKLDERKVIAVLFVLGFALRLVYCIDFNYTRNQHDVEGLSSNGHLSYIYRLAMGEGLPETNNWQYSHPPLHHWIASLVVRLSFSFGFGNAVAFENIQLLTCLYSTLTMFAGYSLLKECKVEGRALVFSSALLSFHPVFFILAGSINNDILSILLTVYALVFLAKWYNKPSVISALLCGLFVGLGMMTKFTVALVAVVAAITVFIKFLSDKTLKFSKFLSHAGCFLAVMLPLGLWYQIRNGILFNQPIGYVAPISTTSKLYIGDMNIAQRLLYPYSSAASGVYVDVWNEHNLWHYLLRNSLFGEYKFGNEGFALFAVMANLLLALLTVIAFVYLIIRLVKHKDCALSVVIMFAVQWLFFIYFNIVSPYRCSMDFRYIVPVLFCSTVFLGVAGTKADKSDSVLAGIYMAFSRVVISVLCIASILIFV